MNVLLTGPFGTIGTCVLAELLQRGHRVTCFDLDNKNNRKKARQYGERIRMIWGDITDPASVKSAVKDQKAVIHLAALIPPFSEEKPVLAERINVQGTQFVVDAISEQAVMPLLVFPSSISVHGWSANRPAPCQIDMPFDAKDAYAGHKIACEALLRASSVPWVILRIGACVDGFSTDKGGEQKAAMKHMFSLHPETRIEYLHPEDAALAMNNALDNPEVIGKTLFLGSGRSSQMSWIEFINTVPRAMGLGDLPVEAFGDAPYYTDWMNTEESERLLQFQRHGYEKYLQEVHHKWRVPRVLLTPARGLVKRIMLSMSPAYEAHQRR